LARDFHVEVSPVRLLAGPTIHLLAQQLAQQIAVSGTESPEKTTSRKRTAPQSAPAAAQTEFVPLSWQQLPIWGLVRQAPGHSFFNLPAAIRLRGPFDIDAFAAAMAKLVQRHATLRSVFQDSDTGPVQGFPSGFEFETQIEDLSGTREEERAAVLDARARAFSLSGYRPGDPVFRAAVLRFAATDHAVLISVHHLAADGASLPLLVQDGMSLYLGMPLASPAWTYADFVRWQRDALTEARVGELTEFWRNALDGCKHLLPLPFDRERPALSSFEGAQVSFDVPPPVAAALREFGRAEQCTLFTTLLTGLGVFIHRLTGVDDFCVGTFVAGRAAPESRSAVGCFINQLPLRIDLRGDPSIRALTRRVRKMALAAQANAELPFAMLMNQLQGVFPSGQPAIQVVLILHNELGSRDRFRMRGPNGRLEIEFVECHNGGAKRDLTFHVYEEGDGLRGSLEYDTQLFPASSAQEMAAAYVDALQLLANNPDADS
jgi:hypothetical protein